MLSVVQIIRGFRSVFMLMRGSKYHYKRAINGPPAKRHLKWHFAGWPIAKKPYILWFFRGRRIWTSVHPPSGSAHANYQNNEHITLLQIFTINSSILLIIRVVLVTNKGNNSKKYIWILFYWLIRKLIRLLLTTYQVFYKLHILRKGLQNEEDKKKSQSNIPLRNR